MSPQTPPPVLARDARNPKSAPHFPFDNPPPPPLLSPSLPTFYSSCPTPSPINLHEIYLVSGVSVPAPSGYPALSKLLNAVGDSLKPTISAVIHPAKNGVGIPDGGLFSLKEIRKHGSDSPSLFGTVKPERGVIEVKPPDLDLAAEPPPSQADAR